ncbi:hypothetical protein [Methylobacterium oryzihabitans]|uniref:REase AHJR-like domain-containing protein n=1 Tax=Methylobacterium oryzihabitans TaxID=2499852 RepID=A0A437NXM2_9HYPH|nr:hypothetical protein [Methylobacterium oryzihabitans]RVU14771.1 hypothetical protein EOE48_22115 [Methylobacterium oryzihabitans]
MTYRPSDSDELAARIDDLMGRLRRDVGKRGWTFHVQPSSEVIPEFLKGYQPDALGIGPDGGIVIKIRVRGRETQAESLADLAKLVESQNGWELRVFYVSPPAEVAPGLPAPTSGELASGLAEARVLLDGVHERAALVMAWSLLEAMARLVSPTEEKARARPLSPVQAVQTLAEMGYLEEADARRLRDLTRLRNAVVHGGLGTIVPAHDVARLIHDLEGITHSLDEAA